MTSMSWSQAQHRRWQRRHPGLTRVVTRTANTDAMQTVHRAAILNRRRCSTCGDTNGACGC
jgi:hypothetical protein